jgi:hypothetical protein
MARGEHRRGAVSAARSAASELAIPPVHTLPREMGNPAGLAPRTERAAVPTELLALIRRAYPADGARRARSSTTV